MASAARSTGRAAAGSPRTGVSSSVLPRYGPVWASAERISAIASGGAGQVTDFAPAVTAGADAVLAASVFHFGEVRIGEVKESLRAAGHPVR
jgi:isopentenyl diphosphate isomerase/L-lactate dehydrogenase-like FMN-dependent dehydrogenase